MPLTKKGKKIMSSMKEQYGEKKGESVFYASRNKGNIKGVEKMHDGGVVPADGTYELQKGERVVPNDKGPSTGPDFALRQSDAEEMQRAMKGVTTSRSAGMAHKTAEKQMAKDKQYHNNDGAHGKHTGAAEDMRPGGPREVQHLRQNAPFRGLDMSGHDLNHTFKNPVPFSGMDVKAAGTNHSYLHPHSHSGMKEVPAGGFVKANIIKPMSQAGTGKK